MQNLYKNWLLLFTINFLYCTSLDSASINLSSPEPISAITYLKSKTVAYSFKNTIRFFNKLHPTSFFDVKADNHNINCLINFNNDLICGTDDGYLLIIVLENFGNIKKFFFKAHDGPISNLLNLKDGRIVSVANDNTIKFWSLLEFPKLTQLTTITGDQENVISIINICNCLLISASKEGTIKVWDIRKSYDLQIIECLTQIRTGQQITAMTKINDVGNFVIAFNNGILLMLNVNFVQEPRLSVVSEFHIIDSQITCLKKICNKLVCSYANGKILLMDIFSMFSGSLHVHKVELENVNPVKHLLKIQENIITFVRIGNVVEVMDVILYDITYAKNSFYIKFVLPTN